MNKRKQGKDRHVSSGVSLPNEMFDEIDQYMDYYDIKCSRSEFIRNTIRAPLDEWKKDKELREAQRTNICDNSPLGLISYGISSNGNGSVTKEKEEITATVINEFHIPAIDQYIDKKDDLKDLTLISPGVNKVSRKLNFKIDKIQNPKLNKPTKEDQLGDALLKKESDRLKELAAQADNDRRKQREENESNN